MRVRYQYPFKGILNDLDGSLTSLGPNTWATAMWDHNAKQPECTTDMVVYDGLICNSSIQIRRIAIHGYKPSSLDKRNLFIFPYDDAVVGGMN